MMRYRMRLEGDWAKAFEYLDNTAAVKAAENAAVLEEAHEAQRRIVKGITSQAPAGKQFVALSRLTLLFRRVRGFGGKKALIVTGGLRNSVVVEQKAPGKVYVGVSRSAKNPNGKLYYDIAKIQEFGAVILIRVTSRMRRYLMAHIKGRYGTRSSDFKRRDTKGRFRTVGQGGLATGVLVIKIPPRPFIKPVLDDMLKNREATVARVQKRIVKHLKGTLGKI